MIVPVTQEQAGFTTFLSSFSSGPFYKSQAVFVVQRAVAFEAKVNVSEYCGFAE
jgi:hypothetical protein